MQLDLHLRPLLLSAVPRPVPVPARQAAHAHLAGGRRGRGGRAGEEGRGQGRHDAAVRHVVNQSLVPHLHNSIHLVVCEADLYILKLYVTLVSFISAKSEIG